MRLPTILVPYPFAADNHQFTNARAFSDVGAALLLEQKTATPQTMGETILKLLRDERKRAALSQELVRWHAPQAAEHIAERMLALMQVMSRGPGAVSGAADQRPRSGERDRSDRRTGILPVADCLNS